MTNAMILSDIEKTQKEIDGGKATVAALEQEIKDQSDKLAKLDEILGVLYSKRDQIKNSSQVIPIAEFKVLQKDLSKARIARRSCAQEIQKTKNFQHLASLYLEQQQKSLIKLNEILNKSSNVIPFRRSTND